MNKPLKLLLDYGFVNLDDLQDTLKNGKREGRDNLYFENAMQCVSDLFDLSQSLEKKLEKEKEYTREYMKSDFIF